MTSVRNVLQMVLGPAQMLLSGGGGGAQQPPQQKQLLRQHQPSVFGTPLSCPNAQVSCRNTTAVDTCCFNSPGGQLLLTQFWDANPPLGPTDSWTIHGLWPDNCDGSFESYCDRRREYNNITDVLEAAGAGKDLLTTMRTYWKSLKNDDEQLWEHEWNKHGTCISTLRPRCYAGYAPGQELVDYFGKAVDLFRQLDTYKALKEAGITPSRSKKYTAAQLQEALTGVTGFEVTLRCKNGVFKEVFYHFNVRGSLQTGTFIPTEPDGLKSSCPKKGIRYPPKSRN